MIAAWMEARFAWSPWRAIAHGGRSLLEGPFRQFASQRKEVAEYLEVGKPFLEREGGACGDADGRHQQVCLCKAQWRLEGAECANGLEHARSAHHYAYGQDGDYGKPVLREELFLVRRLPVDGVKLKGEYEDCAGFREFQHEYGPLVGRGEEPDFHGKPEDGKEEKKDYADGD